MLGLCERLKPLQLTTMTEPSPVNEEKFNNLFAHLSGWKELRSFEKTFNGIISSSVEDGVFSVKFLGNNGDLINCDHTFLCGSTFVRFADFK